MARQRTKRRSGIGIRTRALRKIKFTREGKYVFFIAIGIGFAAVNTGNNLLYLVVGLLISMILVSGVLSELSLFRLTARRGAHGELFALRPSRLPITVESSSERHRSFSLELYHHFAAPKDIRSQEPGRIMVLEPGDQATRSSTVTFGRRGVVEALGIRVATQYPFSFFIKNLYVDTRQELLVFPAIVDLPFSLPELLGGSGDTESQNERGLGTEFYGLKEFSEHDDPRHIHWKVSARMRRLVVKELERPMGRRVVLVPHCHEGAVDGDPGWETAVSGATSLAVALLTQGYAVGVKTPGRFVPPDRGDEQRWRLLRALALATPPVVTTTSLADVDAVVISTRGEGQPGSSAEPTDLELTLPLITAGDEEGAKR